MISFRVSLTGCLQLLEISRNLKTLLEILEICWNLIGPPGNFCVRCRRLTALVSSHKNMDKYLLQKYEIYRHQMCFFKFQMHQNPFLAGAPPQTLVRELMTLRSSQKEAEARQTCPGFFLKSLLESPGNWLD